MTEELFKKLFPHLAKEMEEGTSKISANETNQLGSNKSVLKRKWAGYNPDVIDFLRRCVDDEQAEQVIKFLEEREKITHEETNKYRLQLREKGIRSFGSKKEADFYHKNR